MIGIIKIAFCFSLFCLAAFVQVPLLQYDWGIDAYTQYDYSLLYILCFLLSLVFKNNYAFVAVILYLAAGLSGLPIFAFGGGLSYVFEPSFGYLLGLMPLSIISFFFRYHMPHYGLKVFNINIAPILALFAAHGLGLLVLALTAKFCSNNLLNLSLWQLTYDLFFAPVVLALLLFKEET